jgi:hypothetical protein
MSNELTNLEILRMAKDIVINEHTDRRAQLHNAWLVESDRLWRTKKLKLAYPTIPPYPTEVDIVIRAQSLFAFLNTAETTTQPVVEELPPVVEELPPVVEELPRAPVPPPEPIPSDTNGRILPGVLKKLEEMRSSWTK